MVVVRGVRAHVSVYDVAYVRLIFSRVGLWRSLEKVCYIDHVHILIVSLKYNEYH